MTWQELCEKAKKMGYEDYFDFRGVKAMRDDKGLSFHSNGKMCYDAKIFAEGRTYDQMYQIMEALR